MANENQVYNSIYTGQQIDDTIRIILESFSSMPQDIENLQALVNELDTILNNGALGLVDRVEKIEKDLLTKLPLAGGKMTGQIKTDINNNSLISINNFNQESEEKFFPSFEFQTKDGKIIQGINNPSGDLSWQFQKKDSTDLASLSRLTTSGQLYGAVWNDFAEYRKSNEREPGRVICECGDGTLIRASKRLQQGANIISDTFGFAIGETEECQTPVAVAGRVLAYPYEDWWTFEPGEPVCAGPNGTISKMTRREVRKYPDRIIGTVSELPTYENWGQNQIKVNGRIWIKVK